jgi:hypothetical protein
VSVADDVEYLLTTVGPRITAVGVGLTDARPLIAWRNGNMPTDEAIRARLSILCRVVQHITATDSPAVAAAFLRGSNPDFFDQSVLILISDALPERVPALTIAILDSANRFLEGAPS